MLIRLQTKPGMAVLDQSKWRQDIWAWPDVEITLSKARALSSRLQKGSKIRLPDAQKRTPVIGH